MKMKGNWGSLSMGIARAVIPFKAGSGNSARPERTMLKLFQTYFLLSKAWGNCFK
jgi:hypothetical protein